MTKMEELAKATRAEDAYKTLKSQIRTNLLPPGYQAPEPEFAVRLGVSRTTVREALVRLEGDGLVELIPRRGARVLPLRAEDMREIYEILTALESDAAAALASRKPTKAALQPLVETTDTMQDALDRNALVDWAEADDEFHLGLLQLHGNKRLVGFVQSLADQAHRARIATLRLRDIPKKSTQEHKAIMRGLLKGDPDAARDAIRAHRTRAAQELLEILEKLPQL